MIEITIRFEKRPDGKMTIRYFPNRVEGDFRKEGEHYDKVCKMIGDYYFALEKGSDGRSYHSFDSRTFIFDEAEKEENL